MMNEDWLKTVAAIGMIAFRSPRCSFEAVTAERGRLLCWALVGRGGGFAGPIGSANRRLGPCALAMLPGRLGRAPSGVSVSRRQTQCFLGRRFARGYAGGVYTYHIRAISSEDFTVPESSHPDHGGDRRPGHAFLVAAFRCGLVVRCGIPALVREFRLILFGVLVIVLMGRPHAASALVCIHKRFWTSLH